MEAGRNKENRSIVRQRDGGRRHRTPRDCLCVMNQASSAAWRREPPVEAKGMALGIRVSFVAANSTSCRIEGASVPVASYLKC